MTEMQSKQEALWKNMIGNPLLSCCSKTVYSNHTFLTVLSVNKSRQWTTVWSWILQECSRECSSSSRKAWAPDWPSSQRWTTPRHAVTVYYIYALLLRSSKIESVFFSLCSTCGPVSCMQHKYYSNPIDAVFLLFFAMLYHLAIRYYVGSLSLSYLPKTCLNAKKNEQSFIGQEGIRDVTSAIVIARWAKITFRHESKLSFINSRVTT